MIVKHRCLIHSLARVEDGRHLAHWRRCAHPSIHVNDNFSEAMAVLFNVAAASFRMVQEQLRRMAVEIRCVSYSQEMHTRATSSSSGQFKRNKSPECLISPLAAMEPQFRPLS